MKRFFLLLFLFLMCAAVKPVMADDADFWDEPMKVDQAAKNQEKAVTNQ